MKAKHVAIISVSLFTLSAVGLYVYYLVKTFNTTKIEDTGADIYIKND
jgi:hypothetical protein